MLQLFVKCVQKVFYFNYVYLIVSGSYCPEDGATTHVKCPAGKYGKTKRATGEQSCLPCDAGFFGNSDGLSSSQCSGRCDLNRYCPPGSTSPQGVGECMIGPSVASDCKIAECNILSYFCPVDAVFLGYTDWSDCNGICNGIQSRTSLYTPARYGGNAAISITKYQTCNTQNCACKLGSWEKMSDCKNVPVLGKIMWQSRTLFDPNQVGIPCKSEIPSVQAIPC